MHNDRALTVQSICNLLQSLIVILLYDAINGAHCHFIGVAHRKVPAQESLKWKRAL